MDLRNNRITVREILANPKAKAIFYRESPVPINHPMIVKYQNLPLSTVLMYAKRYVPQRKINALMEELRSI
ncbi:hypothetical protein [Youxingia wuxianensis]|uniref:Uncharacterized protein n=1 Tax=Youxingia wuxianensis TaxID=2763678 RepID=A0A926IHA0_9FIRM|nr:hypothetical protein [Youxingia wuxianensis]MBC8584925.1 hypothetical protein [Youxingia wuxianensis]